MHGLIDAWRDVQCTMSYRSTDVERGKGAQHVAHDAVQRGVGLEGEADDDRRGHHAEGEDEELAAAVDVDRPGAAGDLAESILRRKPQHESRGRTLLHCSGVVEL